MIYNKVLTGLLTTEVIQNIKKSKPFRVYPNNYFIFFVEKVVILFDMVFPSITLEGEESTKTERKWKKKDGSPRDFCGLSRRKM